MYQSETDRILLRKLKVSDLFSVYLNIRDKEVGKWTGPPRKECMENPVGSIIGRLAEHFIKGSKMIARAFFKSKKEKCLRLGIVLKETGKVIGIVSFTKNNHEDDFADLGFWIGRKYWGKGLISEVLPSAFEFGFKHWGLECIKAWTFEDNVGSKKAMVKCGMVQESVIENAYVKYNKLRNRINFEISKKQYIDD